jgi:hypothetical protein
MLQAIKNLFGGNKYKNHPEAIIISCFYNPTNSPYRLKAFQEYHKTIKHLNHYIIECVIGEGDNQLSGIAHETVKTDSLLWHKEGLINLVVSRLPKKFKYVYWVDADVLFQNKNWMVDGVEELKKGAKIIQPFDVCIHLNKDQMKPDFDVEAKKKHLDSLPVRHKQMWRSFAYNNALKRLEGVSTNYDLHGHVGFAWGAQREVLEAVPLYDKALIGGADHIIAHAAMGQIPHSCITKSFADNLDEVVKWSQRFYQVVEGRIGYVSGDLWHIWHGEIQKRQYLKRIQDFTKKTTVIQKRDDNGLYVNEDGETDDYIRRYFNHRETVTDPYNVLYNESNPIHVAIDAADPSVFHPQLDDFGGGSGGGAGAGGSWDTPQADVGNTPDSGPTDFIQGGDIEAAIESQNFS